MVGHNKQTRARKKAVELLWLHLRDIDVDPSKRLIWYVSRHARLQGFDVYGPRGYGGYISELSGRTTNTLVGFVGAGRSLHKMSLGPRYAPHHLVWFLT